MTKEEALKQFAELGAVWFGNSKQPILHSRPTAVCKAGTSWPTNGRKKLKRNGTKQRKCYSVW